jgi:hypothetical protein
LRRPDPGVAIARFDQVEGVSDEARDRAWPRIEAAANKYDVDVSAHDWRDLFKGAGPTRVSHRLGSTTWVTTQRSGRSSDGWSS